MKRLKVDLGGDRIGSGNNMEVEMHNYGTSNHDQGYLFRTTMAPLTLVPFMAEVGLPGSRCSIDISRLQIMTLPTLGPLFGSFKFQAEVFTSPMKNYNADLHMNLQGTGLNMANIKLPQIRLEATTPKTTTGIDTSQINGSCVLRYLGISALGSKNDEVGDYIAREFEAGMWLSYIDYYKQYHANKQEGIGVVIHNNLETTVYTTIVQVDLTTNGNVISLTKLGQTGGTPTGEILTLDAELRYQFTGLVEIDTDDFYFTIGNKLIRASQLFQTIDTTSFANTVIFTDPNMDIDLQINASIFGWYNVVSTLNSLNDTSPKLRKFSLSNIDDMRKKILRADDASAFVISRDMSPLGDPYKCLLNARVEDNRRFYSIQSNQEGLLVKPYLSDQFNNWLDTEWIDGDNGVNEVTKVIITDNAFTLDQLLIQKKLYVMMNRIAVSGGSVQDRRKAVYGVVDMSNTENPVYRGGMSAEVIFQEVISNAASEGQPIGTLAGRGTVMDRSEKGGRIQIDFKEEAYVIGVCSLTPRLDYSQGNKWHVNIKTMDDWHKPELDGIGFQELITDKMAAWSTEITPSNANPAIVGDITFKSAGKQTAWLDYQTNVNRVYGNFAVDTDSMWMVLNRRYEAELNPQGNADIKDLTTYGDPTHYNHIFAQTSLDAQNFWVQMNVKINFTRKMSRSQMPNL